MAQANESAPLLRGEDWEYLAEGGQHVVFKYTASESIQKVLVGQVLRVRKPSNHSEWTHPLLGSSQFLREYDLNVNRVLYSNASDFFQQPTYCTLDEGFLVDLTRIVKLQRSSKFKGQPLWGDHVQSEGAGLREVCGQLVWNMCLVQEGVGCSDDDGAEGKSLTLELKIKGGFPSVSPFLSSSSSQVKRMFGRYQLKQLSDTGETGSNPLSPMIETHDPRDLFSMDASRIRKSLDHLLEAPKSILRMSIDGVAIDWKEDRSINGSRTPLEGVDLLSEAFDSTAVTENVVTEVMTAILLQSGLLTDISAAQKLDFIDIEGAHKVFSHLVTLTGDFREAESKLCESVTQMKDLLEVLKGVSIEQTGCNDNDNKNEIPEFLKALGMLQSSSATPCEDERSVVDSYLRSLGIHECCVLLNLWLISLAAKDFSIVVTFKVERSSAQSSKYNFERVGDRWPPVSSRASGGAHGRMELAGMPENQYRSFKKPRKISVCYASCVIDTGYKDPSKCWGKLEGETRLCEAVSCLMSSPA